MRFEHLASSSFRSVSAWIRSQCHFDTRDVLDYIRASKAQWLICRILCFVADTWDSLFPLVPVKQPKISSEPSDIDSLTDEEILALLPQGAKIKDDSPYVLRITPGTVAKKVYDETHSDTPDCFEANAHELVYGKTGIPVPRIRRVIKMEKSCHLIVMDYVEGKSLAEVWKTFTVWQKFRVARILRCYVRQLHKIIATPQTPPGPISESGPQPCYLPSVFGSEIRGARGPFASYKEMTAFLEDRYTVYPKFFESFPEAADYWDPNARFDDSFPLAITHNGLIADNIIVGNDVRLWILDWSWAGFYPPWFELCAMEWLSSVRGCDEGWVDWFWELMVPFVCGPYFKQQNYMDKTAPGLYCQ